MFYEVEMNNFKRVRIKIKEKIKDEIFTRKFDISSLILLPYS
jgi:hypothetical protein